MQGSWRVLCSVLLLRLYIFPLLQYGLSLLSCSLSRKIKKKKRSGSVFSGSSHFSPGWAVTWIPWAMSSILGHSWATGNMCCGAWSTTSTSDFGVLSTVSHFSLCLATPFLPVQLFFCPFFHRGDTNKFGSALACSGFILKFWPTVGLYWSQLERSVRHRRAAGLSPQRLALELTSAYQNPATWP